MRNGSALLLAVAGMLLLAACGARVPAPVEDRSEPRPAESRTGPPREIPAQGTHRVQRGDTLYSIAFRYDLDWRNLARWNGISAPYTIRVGETLLLRRGRSAAPAVARTDPEPGKTGSRDRPAAQPGVGPEPGPEPGPAPADSSPAPQTRAEPPSVTPDDPARAAAPIAEADERTVSGVIWRWPTEGRVSRRFDDSATRKGIHIAGSEGQPVVAAAEGQVVYSGTGLIGYGELIIIKHSGDLLSAYAHNRRRLVAEGDRVRAGEAIAELGLNERDDQILHFEIRRNGQPEDPLRFLPAR